MTQNIVIPTESQQPLIGLRKAEDLRDYLN